MATAFQSEQITKENIMQLKQEQLNYLRVRFNIPLFYIGHVNNDNNTINFSGLDDKEYLVIPEEDKVIEIDN